MASIVVSSALAAGQYPMVEADQKGVDLVLTLFSELFERQTNKSVSLLADRLNLDRGFCWIKR